LGFNQIYFPLGLGFIAPAPDLAGAGFAFPLSVLLSEVAGLPAFSLVFAMIIEI
jgi:hypothetical protein